MCDSNMIFEDMVSYINALNTNKSTQKYQLLLRIINDELNLGLYSDLQKAISSVNSISSDLEQDQATNFILLLQQTFCDNAFSSGNCSLIK